MPKLMYIVEGLYDCGWTGIDFVDSISDAKALLNLIVAFTPDHCDPLRVRVKTFYPRFFGIDQEMN